MTAFQDTTPFVLALLITFTALVCISMWNNFNSVRVEKEVLKPKTEGPSRTRELLIRFTKFYNDLDAHNNYLYDTQLLPDPKQHIIHALYVGYDESENDEDRKAEMITVEVLPKKLDEEVASLMVAGFGGVVTQLTKDQADYINVPQEGPFKEESYKY